jgi:hypothetical protein
MFIQDSKSRIMRRVTFRLVTLAVDNRRVTPRSGRKDFNAPRPTYTSGRTHNNM